MDFFFKHKVRGLLEKPLHHSTTWYRVPVSGWIVPPERVNYIEISLNDREPQRINLNTDSRPDVRVHFPRVPEIDRAGFYGTIEIGEQEGRYDLEIRAILKGGESYSLGKRTVINSKKFIAQSPRFFHIGLTTRCNMSCIMCPVHGRDPPQGKKFAEIEAPVLARAFEGLNAFSGSVQRFFLADYGEPLLYPGIFEVISRVREICPHASIHMNTNGALLDEEIIHKIIDSELNEIAISLDAATKGTYEKIRKNSDFDLVVGNLERLVRMKKEYGKNSLTIHSNFVMLKSNIEELPEYVRLAGGIGVDLIVAIHPFGIFSGDSSELLLEKNSEGGRSVPDNYMDIIREANRIAGKGNFPVAISSQQSIGPLFTQRFECRCHGASIPHILPDGDVFPCSVLSAKGFSKNSPVKPFGNLNEKTMEEIWQSAEYSEFRSSFFEGRLPHPLCRQCVKYYNF